MNLGTNFHGNGVKIRPGFGDTFLTGERQRHAVPPDIGD